MIPLVTTSHNHPSRERQTRQTIEIWTFLTYQDRSQWLFPMKVPLQTFCSFQIERSLMQMLTCRFLKKI